MPMFHVEHMKNHPFYLILCILTLLVLQSCEKIDETPELSDPIYGDLNNELSLSSKQEVEVKAQLERDLKSFRETLPQTGMYTLLRTKMSNSENLHHIILQQQKFFEIKLEQRKHEVRARYQESLKKNGRPWPDQKEIEDYKIRMKLQHDKFQWDTKNVPRGTENNNKDPKTKKKIETVKPKPTGPESGSAAAPSEH